MTTSKGKGTQIVKVDGFEFQYRDDDYVNLTKMCKQVRRSLSTYLRSNHHKQFIKELALCQNCTADELLEKRVGGVPSEQGTYGHPMIAIHLAQWLSPQFALAIAKLTQSYISADVSLVEDILSRTGNLTSEQSRTLGGQVIDKSSTKDVQWIEARAQTKTSNKTLNQELSTCPNVSKMVYPASQNALVQCLIGSSIKKLKVTRGLSKSASSRDAMDKDELISLSFSEMLASKRLSKSKPSGDKNCAALCGQTAKMVRDFAKETIDKD
jgi:hypothetical protein